jgi:hypothetical protein
MAVSHVTTPALILESQEIHISELEEFLPVEAPMELVCQ